ARDALVDIGGRSVTGRGLLETGEHRHPSGRPSIVVLPPASVPIDVEVRDGADGRPVPARVRLVSVDGRYLPPAGHRDAINRRFFEDTGGDLVLGSSAYAYVPGRFRIDLPIGEIDVEVIGGFDRRPHAERLTIDPSSRRLDIALDRSIDLHAGRWVTADSHVHFLAPSTALLPAAAEGV